MRHLGINSTTALRRMLRTKVFGVKQPTYSKLRVHVHHFCSVINGGLPTEDAVSEQSVGDHDRRSTIRLAFKLLYIGQHYNGMQHQKDKGNTIEDHLFRALRKSRLIEDMKTCRFGKNSRTDSGVSAISQVVSFDVHDGYFSWRSQMRQLVRSHLIDQNQESDRDYTSIDIRLGVVQVNKLLPFDIKVLAWAYVPDDYFPRQQKYCKTYKYWFLKDDLDIELMAQACKRFEGSHDYRNFCRLEYRDHYESCILEAKVEPCEDNSKMCVFTVTGTRFLMHQIRYMVNILFYIGRQQEPPEIIDELLDVEKNPCKPNFGKAEGLALCLHKVAINKDIDWIHDLSIHSKITRDFEEHWRNSMLMTELTKNALDELKNTEFETDDGLKTWKEAVPQNVKKTHKPIMSDQRGPTLEKVKKRHDRNMLRKRLIRDPNYELTDDDRRILLDNPDLGTMSVESDTAEPV